MVNRADWERYLGPAGLALIAIGLIAAVIGVAVLVFDIGGDDGPPTIPPPPQRVFTPAELVPVVEGQLRDEYRQANPSATVGDDVYRGACQISEGATEPWTTDSSIMLSCDLMANQGGTPVKTGQVALYQAFATGLATLIARV
jgi:hypothetical protein